MLGVVNLIDFHVHSCFSLDCKYTMEEMINSAIEKNIDTMAFTDHIDFGFDPSSVDYVFHVSDYYKEYKKLKNNYKDKIELLLGVEVGAHPNLDEKLEMLINLNSLDFVILSIHSVNGKELYDGSFYQNKNLNEIYSDYYDFMLKCLKVFDNFDVIGHLDIVDRYYKFIEKRLDINEYIDILTEVLKKIIDMGKGIELNTSGMRYGIGYFHPNIDILKLYKELGGEIITIGSDSHTPQDIGSQYCEAKKLLKDLEFKYICTFKNRKKQMIRIK